MRHPLYVTMWYVSVFYFLGETPQLHIKVCRHRSRLAYPQLACCHMHGVRAPETLWPTITFLSCEACVVCTRCIADSVPQELDEDLLLTLANFSRAIVKRLENMSLGTRRTVHTLLPTSYSGLSWS